MYEQGQYRIYAIEGARMAGAALGDGSERLRAATLPPRERTRRGGHGPQPRADLRPAPHARSFETEDYKPKLQLDYIGQPTLGVGTGPTGTFVGGGRVVPLQRPPRQPQRRRRAAGQRALPRTSAATIGYENRSHRWSWGAQLESIPYVTGSFADRDRRAGGAYVERSELFRETDRAVADLRRLSVQPRVALRARRRRRATSPSAARSRPWSSIPSPASSSPRTARSSTRRTGIGFGEASAALVYDTALFGATSPILGQRYRFEVSPTFGGLKYTSVLADYRRYVMPFRPITLAGRLLHYGRYGSGGEDARIPPLFVGYPTLDARLRRRTPSAPPSAGSVPTQCPAFDQLVGSRIAVANLELRVPLLGLFNRRNLYGPIPVELIGFSDFGVAWTAENKAKFLGGEGDRSVVKSYGVGARVNVLGFAVVEIDAVKPVDRPQKGWTWVFNFSPGF